MGKGLLKFLLFLFNILAACCAVIVLGIYAYFIAVSTGSGRTSVHGWMVGTLILATILTLFFLLGSFLSLCFGDKRVLGHMGAFMSILAACIFIAIAVLTRRGSKSCNGNRILQTPVGTGRADLDAPGAGSYRTACRINKAAFAVSLIGIFLSLMSALFQCFLVSVARKNKAAPPAASSGPFWKRNKAPVYPTTTTEPYRATHPAAVA